MSLNPLAHCSLEVLGEEVVLLEMGIGVGQYRFL